MIARIGNILHVCFDKACYHLYGSASIRMKSVIRITQKKNPDLIRINPDPDPGQKIRIETGIRIRSNINFLLNYSIFVILHITRYIEPLALHI